MPRPRNCSRARRLHRTGCRAIRSCRWRSVPCRPRLPARSSERSRPISPPPVGRPARRTTESGAPAFRQVDLVERPEIRFGNIRNARPGRFRPGKARELVACRCPLVIDRRKNLGLLFDHLAIVCAQTDMGQPRQTEQDSRQGTEGEHRDRAVSWRRRSSVCVPRDASEMSRPDSWENHARGELTACVKSPIAWWYRGQPFVVVGLKAQAGRSRVG